MDTSLITELAFQVSNLIEKIFVKEGILIFTIFCLMVFVLACFAAFGAWQTGQFKDIESSKYDMFDDPVHDNLEFV